jgi:4-alpha-glucanotransferase
MERSLFPRSSGILLHPTSLDSPYGIGDLGPAAYQFLDFLESAGQSLWQVLPLGPTGYGDSPYQCFSALAGNPLLISLDRLREQGLLSGADLEEARLEPSAQVDYPSVSHRKTGALRKAAVAFGDGLGCKAGFDEFQERQRHWLPDYARFMALKEEFGMAAWPFWPKGEHQADEERVAAHLFLQFTFFEQWRALKEEANRRGIRLMGDIPIYASGDSADVWAQPGLWKLKDDGQPALMAGVPPDYFSATGQLWGNPIYDWAAHAEQGYAWWIARFRATFELFDMVRVDHFRGFQAYFQVPFGETTAVNGEWVTGPGAELFEALERALGRLPVVAENLGVITPEVEAIRKQFGFPGMAILQFAFGKDPQGPDFRPHNYPREMVAYTGTHDNDTTLGWWTSVAGVDSTRSEEDIAEERAFAMAYLGTDGREMTWAFIRALMASVADTVVFPVQDLLGLGKEARMNTPATLGGNWRFRLLPGQLDSGIAERLREFARWYERGGQSG